MSILDFLPSNSGICVRVMMLAIHYTAIHHIISVHIASCTARKPAQLRILQSLQSRGIFFTNCKHADMSRGSTDCCITEQTHPAPGCCRTDTFGDNTDTSRGRTDCCITDTPRANRGCCRRDAS